MHHALPTLATPSEQAAENVWALMTALPPPYAPSSAPRSLCATPAEQAAENVRALMDSLPPMRPLVMVLKVFLQQRELNEVRVVGFAV